MTIVDERPFWSLHTHTKFSVNDALPSPEQCVEKAVELGYPALGVTDHDSISGSVALYKAARKAGIEPLPGMELSVVPDVEYAGRKDIHHLTIAAYNETGYRNLVKIATKTAERFWYRPRIDMADFAELAEAGMTKGLVVATGCHFGLVPKVLMRQGPEAAAKVAMALDSWFPRVYIELQNHGIGAEHHDETDFTDDEVTEGLWQMAQVTGMPVIITQDSHYVEKADKRLHESLKRMVSFSDDVDDAVFPGDPYCMIDKSTLRRYFEPKILAAGLDSLASLAEVAHVRLPELEKFSLKVPDIGVENPQEHLEQLCAAAMGAFGLFDSPVHVAQLESELEVIRLGGMAPYLLFVDKVCTFMRKQGIAYHARGSAAGCFVLYLLKVTQLDPLKFKLRFDRFLSRLRLKPPDVDLDIEHRRREEVVAFIKRSWAVRPCGSLMKYSLEEEDEGDESKGSLRVRFYAALRKRGVESTVWSKIPKADRDDLMSLSALKLIKGYGTHAAGLIVASSEEEVAGLPMARVGDHLVTAYDKKAVELMGFTKLDLLGLRTKTAIKITTDLLGIDFMDIPEGDSETFKMIAAGEVSGVFQLSGFTMRKNIPRLKPKNIEDIIAAQALFRPATINSGATGDFISRRDRKSTVPPQHPDITAATSTTYGVLLYQEQVMDVLQILGMDPGELEVMLDAVKASNEYTAGATKAIAEAMPRIKSLSQERGWSQEDLRWLVESLGAYADYSFNRAHAASYGVVSYGCAWLKKHHPVEFWCGMLDAYSDASKTKGKEHPTVVFGRAARRDGVKVFGPHVNKSGVSYGMDRDHHAIRKGLTTVSGVGKVCATELVANAPYESLLDLAKRVNNRKVTGSKHVVLGVDPMDAGGNIAELLDANALTGLK